ncbi:hypothetical protein G6F65_022419 [Rhizopus arrhizus]|nr:hypothetical protein G6F65_022419 [Rhizopus arrhizus]
MGMIPWTGACITVLLGGRISDLLFKRTGSLKIARSWFAAACLLATTLCFLLVSQAQSVFAVIALMTLANALNALPNSRPDALLRQHRLHPGADPDGLPDGAPWLFGDVHRRIGGDSRRHGR